MTGLVFESKQLAPDRLWLKASGSLSGESTAQIQDWVTKTAALIAHMHEQSGKTISCVFDLVGIKEAKDPAVINALVDFQKQNKPHIHRTGLVVKDPEIRLALSIVGALADRYNIRSFASNQEAESWAFSDRE